MTTTIRQGLAGALGGWLGFLLLEPGIRREELSGAAGSGLSLVVVGFLLGGLITFCLSAAEELSTGRWARLLTRGVLSGLGGAMLGYGFLLIATALYRELASLGESGILALQVLRRTLVWGVWGAGVGLGAGLVSRSRRRVLQGGAGGLLGGLTGGLFFDALPVLTGDAGLSRMVGFVGIGLSVGLATALVEQWVSVAWVKFLSGSREGQVIYLHRDHLVLGRDELADIPLFGDPSVDRDQAVLQLVPSPSIHEVGPESLLRVDGAACRSSPLRDGSILEIGTHRLRFHQRGTAPGSVDTPFPAAMRSVEEGLARSEAVPEVTVMGSAMPPARPALSPSENALRQDRAAVALRIIAGPSVGARIPLRAGLTLGREKDNGLSLADLRVSRYHARIDRIEESWVLSDLQSSNGTRLNGIRILRGGVEIGDYLYLGDCVLCVEGS